MTLLHIELVSAGMGDHLQVGTPRPVKQQEALLWHRDRDMRLSVEILQLQNIPFEI